MQQRAIFLIAIILFMISFASPVVAADQGNKSVEEWLQNRQEESFPERENLPEEEISEPVGVTAGDVIRSIFALLIVISLLVLVLKWLQKKTSPIAETNLIRNLGGTGVGHNRSVQLVKIGDRILVVGVGENVTLLKEITEAREVDELLQELESQSSSTPDWREWFQRFANQFSDREKPPEETSFQKVFQDELNALVKKRKQVLEKGKKKEWNGNE